MQTMEKSVADAILERKSQVTICGRAYEVAPPTPATLIMASEHIAELPDIATQGDNIVVEVLGKAKDAKSIGKIAATLILGAKRINQKKKVRTGMLRWQGEFEWMAQYILENMTTSEIAKVISQRLADMQIGDFFGLTTSLKGANLTKPTKEVVTASGE